LLGLRTGTTDLTQIKSFLVTDVTFVSLILSELFMNNILTNVK